MKQITSQIETITPAIAAEYLKNNQTNRALSMATVKSYSETMKRGEWLLNGESIDFDWNNNLLNGQHRLQAIVKSGQSIQTFVVRNLDPKVYTSYDCGRSRDAGQLIGMQGVPNYNCVATCVKIAYFLENSLQICSGGRKPVNLTNYGIVNLFESNREGYIESAKFTVSIRHNVGKLPISMGYIAGVHYYLINVLKHQKEDVEYFLSSIFTYESCDNAMLDSLRIRFLKDISTTTKLTFEYKQMLLTKVWNAYIEGKNLKCIKWDKESEGILYFK